MKKITNFLIIIFMYALLLNAQTQKPCSDPAASQFDFWVGDWNLTWSNQNGETQTGTNKIEKILGGCVIAENFNSDDINFTGKSFSVYSPTKEKWLQTWVDNNGSYLDFEGEMKDDKMILSRSFIKAEQQTEQRMIFYNISDDSFDWNWERSLDEGKTWELRWKIHYERIR